MPRGEVHIQLVVDYADDEKLSDVSRSARLLWVDALCLAKRLMTDGIVTERQIAKLVHPERDAVAKRLTAELLASGGFTASDRGLRVSGFLKRNKSKAQIIADREAAQESADKGNHQRWHVAKGETSTSCRFCIAEGIASPIAPPIGSGSGNGSGSTSRVVSPETETETETETIANDRQADPPTGRKRPKTSCPDLFKITDEMRGWASERVPQIDVDLDTERFLTSAKANDRRYADWAHAWRNWLLSPFDHVLKEAPKLQPRSDMDRMFG